MLFFLWDIFEQLLMVGIMIHGFAVSMESCLPSLQVSPASL